MPSPLLVVTPTTRSVALQDLPESAFRIIAGKPVDDEGNSPQDLFRAVPWLYRGISLRAHALADLPYDLLRGSDTIEQPETVLPWLARLPELLLRTELALCIFGAGYWLRERNRLKTLGFRWVYPNSIKPQFDPDKGLVGFVRTINGREPMPLSLDEVVYFWQPSPDQELGPGPAPAAVAALAAGLVKSVDEWATGFFKRGATPLTLLSVEGNPPNAELERLEKWWKRLLGGVRRAFETVAIKATVKPQIIGSPPKDLSMPELTQAKREDVATALGIPHSLVFSDAANYATAQQDDLHFYTKTVIPNATSLVAAALNQQVFDALGYKLVFRPDRLHVFEAQEDTKAVGLTDLYQAGLLTRNEVREQLGYDPVADGDDFHTPVVQQTLENPETEPEPSSGGASSQAKRAELSAWRRKALRGLKLGQADVPFSSDLLEPSLQAAIHAALRRASTAEEVRAAFLAVPFRRQALSYP